MANPPQKSSILSMPRGDGIRRFPGLSRNTFFGHGEPKDSRSPAICGRRKSMISLLPRRSQADQDRRVAYILVDALRWELAPELPEVLGVDFRRASNWLSEPRPVLPKSAWRLCCPPQPVDYGLAAPQRCK